MKKMFNILIIMIFIYTILCVNYTFATFTETIILDSLNIELDKKIVHPSEQVTINIDFGYDISSYEVDVAYDNNLFEYVGTDNDADINDNGDIVTIIYPNSSVSTVANGLSIIFKAKENIISSNPTNFKITLQNLIDGTTSGIISNPISPIEKNIIVEPIYTDYEISLDYDGTILANEEKNMKLVITSDLGKNYNNTKIFATVTNAGGDSSAKILAMDANGNEYNFLYEGWGGENGDPLGGKDIVKELDLRGIFSKNGNYVVTFKIVDINNSNFVIASKAFNVSVGNVLNGIESNLNNTIQNTVGSAIGEIQANLNNITQTETTKPTILPKAGNTIYFMLIPIGIILVLAYVSLKKKDNEI